MAPDQLASSISDRFGGTERPLLWVVECSESQATDLASEVRRWFRVDARPWSLERDGEPPEGQVLATYFHYNDLRRRWPGRFTDVRFATIRPDAELRRAIGRVVQGPPPHPVFVCERDATMASSILADLRAILPPEAFDVATLVASDPNDAVTEDDPRVLLFAPRVWARLDPDARDDPRRMEVTYRFNEAELAAIAQDLGWAPHTPAPSPAHNAEALALSN